MSKMDDLPIPPPFPDFMFSCASLLELLSNLKRRQECLETAVDCALNLPPFPTELFQILSEVCKMVYNIYSSQHDTIDQIFQALFPHS